MAELTSLYLQVPPRSTMTPQTGQAQPVCVHALRDTGTSPADLLIDKRPARGPLYPRLGDGVAEGPPALALAGTVPKLVLPIYVLGIQLTLGDHRGKPPVGTIL